MREDIAALVASLRQFEMPALLSERRTNYDKAAKAFPLPAGFQCETWQAGALKGERIVPPHCDARRTLLYLHGGGYSMGSARSHRHLAAALAAAAHASAVVLDYRLAPEHPFPAAFEDAMAAWQFLAQSSGNSVFALAGDSAGGGLALACAAALGGTQGATRPAAVACISPWVDLSLSQALPDSDADPLMKLALNREYANNYLGAASANDPRASPVHADLSNLPPTLIQVGSSEQIRGDADRIAARARAAGVEVTLDVTDGAPHVWPWFWPRCETSAQAVRAMGGFLDGHLARVLQERTAAEERKQA